MSFSLRDRLCSSGRSLSSELGQACRTLPLRFFFMVTPIAPALGGTRGAGEGGVRGLVEWGGEVGRRRRRGGGRGQGEADRRRAQCLPRISKSVPLERSHTTRHGRKAVCAFTHIHTSRSHPRFPVSYKQLCPHGRGLSWAAGLSQADPERRQRKAR